MLGSVPRQAAMLSVAGIDVLSKLRDVSAGSAAHAALAPLLLWFRDNFCCMRPVVDTELDPDHSR
jgi:hypothetical protein